MNRAGFDVAVTWVDRRVNSHIDNPANSVAIARPSSMAVAVTATYLPVVGLTCRVLMYCDGSPTTESVTVPGQRLLLHRREIDSTWDSSCSGTKGSPQPLGGSANYEYRTISCFSVVPAPCLSSSVRDSI